jgi:hypothetical protein
MRGAEISFFPQPLLKSYTPSFRVDMYEGGRDFDFIVWIG